jgi:ParB family chromosome partitioning protein
MTSVKRNALGRGLSALLESAETDVTSKNELGNSNPVAGSVSNIMLSKIEANPFQPRSAFEISSLQELSESIKQQGIIQPITVRKMGYDRYQIISGERRFRASQMAEMEVIPAYIRIANDQSMLEMALVENIQRENLNAMEVAFSYKRLIDECSLSQEELAEKVGKERSTVTNYLRLLKLPPQIQKALIENLITMGHARAILAVDDVALQLKLFYDIISDSLSVRNVEALVKTVSKNKDKSTPKSLPFEYKRIQDQLARKFETRVELKPEKNGAGKIVLTYFSKDDFDRLLSQLEG